MVLVAAPHPVPVKEKFVYGGGDGGSEPRSDQRRSIVNLVAVTRSLAVAPPLIIVMASIRVHAAFPPSEDTVLDRSAWKWWHCFDFPVDELRRLNFSPKPFKWIRYATGVVVGAHGHLSHRQGELHCVDYNEPLPDSSIDLYYHVDEDKRPQIFPLDPDLFDERSVTHTSDCSRAADFRLQVMQRDGEECVLTNAEALACDAAHLLHHNKGSPVRISSDIT